MSSAGARLASFLALPASRVLQTRLHCAAACLRSTCCTAHGSTRLASPAFYTVTCLAPCHTALYAPLAAFHVLSSCCTLPRLPAGSLFIRCLYLQYTFFLPFSPACRLFLRASPLFLPHQPAAPSPPLLLLLHRLSSPLLTTCRIPRHNSCAIHNHNITNGHGGGSSCRNAAPPAATCTLSCHYSGPPACRCLHHTTPMPCVAGACAGAWCGDALARARQTAALARHHLLAARMAAAGDRRHSHTCAG